MLPFDAALIIVSATFFGIVVAAWISVGPVLCVRYGHRLLSSGRRDTLRQVIRALRYLPLPNGTHLARFFRCRVASDEGETAEATRELEDLLRLLPAGSRLTSWMFAGTIDIWVNAGRYRTALLAARDARWRGASWELSCVGHVNRAEALHNLGRDGLALALLRRQRARLERSALGRNGAIALEAWIFAQRGNAAQARAVFGRIDPKPLSPYYLSEVLYTHAAIELAGNELDRAFTLASHGLAKAVRASSERNGHFLLGRIDLARGQLEQALVHYERGRHHRYRGQGGTALLELGQLYERLNRPNAAREVYAEALARDPESPAARECRARASMLSM